MSLRERELLYRECEVVTWKGDLSRGGTVSLITDDSILVRDRRGPSRRWIPLSRATPATFKQLMEYYAWPIDCSITRDELDKRAATVRGSWSLEEKEMRRRLSRSLQTMVRSL